MLNFAFNHVTATAIVLVLSACATSEIKTIKIERLTPEQLASLQQPANRKLTLDYIISLSKAGTAPADIIKRLQDSGTILPFNAQQKSALAGQGVDEAVIDHIATAQARAAQATRITEQADHEAMQARQQAQERSRRRALEQSYYSGYPPYGPYSPLGPYGYWGPRPAHPGWGPGYYYNNPAIGIGIWR